MMASPSFSASQDLLDLLECPICMDFMYPPIFQCSNGHTLCSKCKPSVKNCCPSCREQMGDIRSLVLEKMSSSLSFPCKYSGAGCSEKVKYDMKQRHEEECSYRPYDCPFPCSPCAVTGDVEGLLTHLRIDHETEFEVGYEIDTVFEHENPYAGGDTSMNLTIYSCLFENFCLHLEAFHSPVDMVYMAFLMFMGDEIDAMNYRYNLEIGNDTRKMTWQGVPRSIREKAEQIRESHDGLVIHRSVAQSFADVNTMEVLRLRVRGLIWREM